MSVRDLHAPLLSGLCLWCFDVVVVVVFYVYLGGKSTFFLLFVLNEMSVVTGRLFMTMEAGADTQQSGETAVSESEAQQISLAQVI